MPTAFWWGNLSVREYLEDLGTDGRRVLKYIFKKCYEMWARTGLVWLRVGAGDGLLSMR